MAAISSLGIGSDLLNNELLDNIINSEKASAELRLDTQQQIIDAKISAYGDVQSKLYDFSEAIVKLADSDNAGATKASSSDESILTATATTSAPAGSYDVEVQNTAKSHSLVSQSYSAPDVKVGAGSLTFNFGTTTYAAGNYDSFTLDPDASTKTITTDSSTTLQQLRDDINNADFGVTASIVNDGSGYVLQMISEDTGKNNSMEVVAKNTSGALATSGLSDFAYNSNQSTPANNMSQTQEGQDAIVIVNGLSVTRENNEVTELIDGVTLNLTSADVGNTVTIKVGADITAISENIQEMVDTYNDFQTLYKDLTKYDADSGAGSLLLGDSTLRSINTQIKSIMTSTVAGITGTNFRSLSELGISTNQNDNFNLKFDSSLFLKGLNENREAVSGVFSTMGTTTDSNITYLNESINTQSGNYDIVVSQLATQGNYQGGSVDLLDFLSPVIINDANDDFSLNLDGKTSSIKLTQGSYATGADLVAELQLQINSASTFKDRGSSVTVNYDALNKSFDFTSNNFGSDSQVYFSSVDTNTANTLGFSQLGKGEYEGTPLSTLNNEYLNGYGTSTVAGAQSIPKDEGIDFSASNASFSISLNGAAAELVTVNLNAAGNDLNGDSVYGDRKDVLQAIQTAVDATALSGNVIATFDDTDKLVFTTTSPSATDSIEITTVGTNTSDVLLGLSASQGPRVNGKDPGLTFGADSKFNVVLDGLISANQVSLPAGTYLTGNDLAAAVETAINTDLAGDTMFAAGGFVREARANEGSRDISTNIDFSTENSGFTVNVNGVEKSIIMDADSGNNITDIQAKLDTAYGAGVVTAVLGTSNGLELRTANLPPSHNDYIQVVDDGRGAYTTGGAVIAGGINFSGANNATFDLVVDGITLNLDVNEDASTGDKDDTLTAVQQAIDTAILNNGQFEVGDIVAKLESGTDQISFETVSRNGIKTSAMFGSAASIEIQNADANAQLSLGLPGVNTSYNGGYDSFGLDDEIKFGSDIDASVSYEYDSVTDKGQLIINIGGQGKTVAFDSVDASAISFLGIHEPDGSETQVKTGRDVSGTINGVEAKGTGQYLSAQNGNVAASNGYYIDEQSSIVTPPLTIDATNDSFTIEVDGFEAVIKVPQMVYSTGVQLAEALQKAINENEILEPEDIEVKVEYTDDLTSALHGKLSIISGSTGSGSSVLIKDISSDASTAFGFTAGQGDGEIGKAQDGEIDEASGVRVKVTGGEIGERGSVSYVSGIADQLKNLMQGILDPSRGALAAKFDALDAQNETLAADRESFEKRIEAKEAQLAAQFAYNDSLIATLNTTASFLTSQFEAMTNSQKK